MTDRTRYAPIENEIRQQLLQAISYAQPYARSSGGFVDWDDLRAAIRLVKHAIERAELLADHKLPPTP
jgi:hypothetical protein